MILFTRLADYLRHVRTPGVRIVRVIAGLDQRHLHVVLFVVAAHVELHLVVPLRAASKCTPAGSHLGMPPDCLFAVAVEDDDVRFVTPAWFRPSIIERIT